MNNSSNMLITPIKALKDNYIWALVNADQAVALVVDPGDAKPVIDYLKSNKLQLSGILITHHHWDHSNGIAELLRVFSVPVIASINSPLKQISQGVDEGDECQPSSYFPPCQVLSIPGHTLDHIAYLVNGALFCGDTLFAAGCGRLFEGSAQQMYDALLKISRLPDETNIYCAHEYTLSNLRFAKIVDPNNTNIDKRIGTITQLRNQGLPSLPSILLEEKKPILF